MNENLAKAIAQAAELCKHFEGYSATPYLCPAGYWTIGYGTVYKPDGTRVTKAHLPVSRALAEAWLLHELQHNYMAGVLQHSPHLVQYPEVLAAMTDFAYNLGTARYRASTLSRKINARDWRGARAELSKWVMGGGKRLPGLVRRREAESRLLPS